MTSLAKDCRYYFWHLPLWGIGARPPHRWSWLCRYLETEAAAFRNGFRELGGYLGFPLNEKELEQATEKALLVKLARESDAYRSIATGWGSFAPRFELEGLEHLQAAVDRRGPLILLTGHIGNFYTIPLALAPLGIVVNTLARSVSPENAWPRRIYEQINYHFTEYAMPGRYLYTDYAGKLDRDLVKICKEGGVLTVLPDIPRALFPRRRLPVIFLGRQSSMPARMVELGLKYQATFLTVWNTIQPGENFTFRRVVRIEEPFPERQGVDEILQTYADRLTILLSREPWQWMAASIVRQFDEDMPHV